MERNMKNLKRLVAAIALTLALGLSAFAGITETPPCAPPEPGQTSTPPCATAQLTPDDSAAPGQTQTPPASSATDYAVTEAAIDLLQSVLSLF